MITRRGVLAGVSLATPAWAAAGAGVLHDRAADLEQRHGGRLGVALLETAAMTSIGYRSAERFPLCSTYKILAAAYVLARVDGRVESLTRRVTYGKGDLVVYSPITEPHADGSGLTIGELCDAAVTLSDNTAGNLLLDSVGGPAGLTSYLRSLGDGVTRLDRREPALNEARPGDPRDTTTPAAMASLLYQTALGPALSASSRTQLTAWLVASKTGARRIRAGLPPAWQAGDKTGSGENGATNDVAVVWPPGRQPLIIAAYYVGAHAADDERNAVLAGIGRAAVAACGP